MQLLSLRARDFRNLVDIELAPRAQFVVLSGANGQGKTNVLEALYLVGTLRSFRATRTQEMIAWGQGAARVLAELARGGQGRTYEVTIDERGRQARLDGKRPRSLGEYFGELNVVLFTPEDLRLPKGSPAGRRRLLDRSVFAWRTAYLEEAQRYARVLRARNLLLREGKGGDLLDVHDEQLAGLGARLTLLRRDYLGELAPRFTAVFRRIFSGHEAELILEAPAEVVGAASESEAASALLLRIRRARARDLATRATAVGPHADDVAFHLDGHRARLHASQGQLRALVLAWRLAEIQLLEERHGEAPLLLLDDVSSELDAERTALLFETLRGSRVSALVTTTDPTTVRIEAFREDYQIVSGRILPLRGPVSSL